MHDTALTHVFSSLNRPSQKFRPPWTSPLTRSPYLLLCNPLCVSANIPTTTPGHGAPATLLFTTTSTTSMTQLTPHYCNISSPYTSPHERNSVSFVIAVWCEAVNLQNALPAESKAPPAHTSWYCIEDSSCQLHHCCMT